MHPAVPAAAVHDDRSFPQCLKPDLAQVFTAFHRSDNAGEDDELLLFRAQERLRLEEGDDLVKQVIPVPDDEHQAGVAIPPVISPVSVRSPAGAGSGRGPDAARRSG